MPGKSYASPMCIGTARPSIEMLLKARAGPSFQRKFCTGPAISPFSIKNIPSRVMYYYVANSFGGLLRKPNSVLANQPLEEPVILKLKLG